MEFTPEKFVAALEAVRTAEAEYKAAIQADEEAQTARAKAAVAKDRASTAVEDARRRLRNLEDAFINRG